MNMPGYLNAVRVNNWRYGCGGSAWESRLPVPGNCRHWHRRYCVTSEGVTQSDRAGNTFAERLRAAATGLYAAAERMGERLRGIAEDVFAYATGQRDAERAGHAVESAGAALERADRTLEPVIQRELEIREARLIQEREHALSLERERQPEIQERTLDGPSLGW